MLPEKENKWNGSKLTDRPVRFPSRPSPCVPERNLYPLLASVSEKRRICIKVSGEKEG